jgi:large subunit ribosomal protein L10
LFHLESYAEDSEWLCRKEVKLRSPRCKAGEIPCDICSPLRLQGYSFWNNAEFQEGGANGVSKNLEIKKEAVTQIKQKFDNAQSVVVVDYKGITVEQVTELRAKFREADVEYCVLKNTLVRRALSERNVGGLDDVLSGPSAFAFGTKDVVSPAKVALDFINNAKTKVLTIKGGLMGNDVISAAMVEELAKTPSRNELLSRLLGSLQSGISGFVRVLDAIATQKAEAN